ncbi:MAG: hypothetical protein VX346_10905 [Planctomycetota bacterium]|nr:hypothetical protein [Planctomycetota bacterium]
MARIRTAVMVTCVTLLSTCVGVIHAEGNRLNERYSQGLHAYYAGEFAAAHSALSEVIQAGFQNPCCYYFRGMVSYRQGDKQAAQQDFQVGAEREANAIRQKFPISKSLERVQGGARVMIERARLQARFAVLQKRLVREKQRYEVLVRNEAKVLRKTPAAPGAAEPAIEIKSKAPNDPFVAGTGLTGSAVQADATAKPAAVGTGVIPGGNQEPAAAAVPAQEEANPFGEDPADAPDAAKPAPAAQPAEANPFGEDPADDADAAKPDEANPFGEPADGADAAKPAPAEQPAAAAPAAESGGNPLGAILRAFSKAAGVEGLVPSAEQLGSELEELLPVNPFGGGEAAAEEDAAATPAKPVENPFAEPAAEKPAAEPSNPFDTPEEEAAAPAKPAPAAKPQAPAEENPFD